MPFRIPGPVIGFEKTAYEVIEPGVEGVATLTVAIVRKGDLSQSSSVRVFTKDGNAESGKDYNPLSKGESLNFISRLTCTAGLARRALPSSACEWLITRADFVVAN